MDLIAEKATELGVSRLCPVFTERTNTARLKVDRLRAIATEAAEQCGRLTLPEIDDPQSLEALLSGWPSDRGLVWLDETGSGAPIADVMAARKKGLPDALLVGPEGGFSPAELKLIGKNLCNACVHGEKAVTRGNRLHCLSQHVAGHSWRLAE